MQAFGSDGEGAPAAPTTASRPLRATCFCRTSRRCFSGSFPTKKPRAYARSFFVKLILAATYSDEKTKFDNGNLRFPVSLIPRIPFVVPSAKDLREAADTIAKLQDFVLRETIVKL